MLREGFTFKSKRITVCSNFGGMGDMIARLPALKVMKEKYSYITTKVYWHDYFVPLAEELLPSDERLSHHKASDIEKDNDPDDVIIDFSPNRVSSLGLNLTTQAFLILMDRLPIWMENQYILANYKMAPDWYYKVENPIIITTGFTAKAREWPAKEINAVAKGILERGGTPVFLGTSQDQALGNQNKTKERANFSEEIDFSQGINLINKTNLIEALAIIQTSEALLGVDNGLLHLSACTKTPAIWGFTSVEANVRIPVGHNRYKIVEAQGCYGCQSKAFAVSHDFRNCMFKDYICTKSMTAERFLNCLDELGVLR